MPRPNRVLWVLSVLLCIGVVGRARGEKPGRLLREIGRWGDGRFVAGNAIDSKAFSSGRLAVGVTRGVIVWDVGTLAEVGRFPLPFDPNNPMLREVALSSDGRRLIVGSDGGASTWDLQAGKRLSEVRWTGFHNPGVTLAASGPLAAVWEKPDAYSATEPTRVELWDLRRRTSRRLPTGGPIWDLRFLDDERWLFPFEVEYSSTTAPFVIARSAAGVVDIREPARTPCRTVKAEACTLAAPNGRWIVEVGQQPEGTLGQRDLVPLVSVTDGATKDRLVIAETRPSSTLSWCRGDVCGETPTNLESARVTLDRRGRRLATIISPAMSAQRLEVWDLGSRRKISSAPLDGGIYDFALSGSGTRILVHEIAGTMQSPRHDLVVFATDTGEPLWRQENIAWGDTPVASQAWIVESAGLVTLLEQPSQLVPGRAVAWDIDTGEQRFALPIGRHAHGRPLAAGGHVAVPASSNGFTVVAARGGAAVLPPDRHAGAVARLALSDDGALLASAGDDGKVIIRSLDGRTAARVLAADAIGDLAFAPGGHQLLAAGRLAATRWDGDKGSPLGEVRATLNGNDGRHVDGARLLGDGERVGFLRDDHSVEIRAWQGDKKARIMTKVCPHGFWPIGVSLAGRGWYGFVDTSNRFVLHELEGDAMRPRADRGIATSEWVIADDGRHVLHQEYGGGAILLATTDASDGPVRLHEGRFGLTAAAFTPDARLAVTALGDATVHVWDVKTKAELDAVDLSTSLDQPTALAISKQGDDLFVGTVRGIVYRFSMTKPGRRGANEPRLPHTF
jgi:WD40 repeat protein